MKVSEDWWVRLCKIVKHCWLSLVKYKLCSALVDYAKAVTNPKESDSIQLLSQHFPLISKFGD